MAVTDRRFFTDKRAMLRTQGKQHAQPQSRDPDDVREEAVMKQREWDTTGRTTTHGLQQPASAALHNA
jgi:hypothetical protein